MMNPLLIGAVAAAIAGAVTVAVTKAPAAGKSYAIYAHVESAAGASLYKYAPDGTEPSWTTKAKCEEALKSEAVQAQLSALKMLLLFQGDELAAESVRGSCELDGPSIGNPA